MNLDFSQMDIGQYHNDKVIELYRGINLPEDSAAVDSMLWTNFENIDYDPSILGMTRSQYNQIVSDILNQEEQIGFDVRNWDNQDFKNSSAYPFIISIMDTIENFQNVSALSQKLDSIQAVAVSQLTCQDKDLVIATVKIAESSAYLWADPSMGGMGFYSQIFQNETQSSNSNFHILSVSERTKKIITAAILSDAGSLSSSFFYLSGALIAGAAVPASDVALLTGIAIRAAAASAFGGFFAWARG